MFHSCRRRRMLATEAIQMTAKGKSQSRINPAERFSTSLPGVPMGWHGLRGKPKAG